MARAEIQRVQQYTPILKGPAGGRYVARAYMVRRPDGRWAAWLAFVSLRTGKAIATDRETTQSTRQHVLYWATGLGRTYLQGAFARALAGQPKARLARRIAGAERQEARALAEAEIHAAAAVSALRRARKSAASSMRA